MAGTILFALTVIVSRTVMAAIFGSPHPAAYFLVLAAVDAWLSIFGFVPQNLLRIQNRPRLFTALAILRHAVTMVLKVGLVMAGWGIVGPLWADIIGTLVFTLALLPTLLRNVTWTFDTSLLREALRFGLPKVPHALLVQTQNFVDRAILNRFVPLSDVGVYDRSYTVGGGVKFASSAFEPAWGPFVYSHIGQADAPQRLARVITYAFGVFVTAALLLSVFGRELLRLLTFKRPEFWAGAPLIPIVAFAYLLHGVFLLSSIGIGIQKKTSVYPAIALGSGAVNILANLWLIPRYGITGAAWATVLSYGTMAALGAYLSHRFYPLPLEVGRLSRLAVAALASFALSLWAPSALWPALAWKTAACLAFPIVLVASGFLQDAEREILQRMIRRERA